MYPEEARRSVQKCVRKKESDRFPKLLAARISRLFCVHWKYSELLKSKVICLLCGLSRTLEMALWMALWRLRFVSIVTTGRCDQSKFRLYYNGHTLAVGYWSQLSVVHRPRTLDRHERRPASTDGKLLLGRSAGDLSRLDHSTIATTAIIGYLEYSMTDIHRRIFLEYSQCENLPLPDINSNDILQRSHRELLGTREANHPFESRRNKKIISEVKRLEDEIVWQTSTWQYGQKIYSSRLHSNSILSRIFRVFLIWNASISPRTMAIRDFQYCCVFCSCKTSQEPSMQEHLLPLQ